jgi:hypothetical protein
VSAPTSHDPLVVTTKDGVTWLRRAVVEGRGLYAVTDSCKCPEYLMATLAELAEHGIARQADVLPMPVGPEPRSELDQARDDVMGACLARWEEEQENARLRLALASAQRGRRVLRARVAELEAELADYTEPDVDGAGRTYESYYPERSVEASADKLTRFFAPSQALREEPHDSPLHHDWRLGRDMPETGGA